MIQNYVFVFRSIRISKKLNVCNDDNKPKGAIEITWFGNKVLQMGLLQAIMQLLKNEPQANIVVKLKGKLTKKQKRSYPLLIKNCNKRLVSGFGRDSDEFYVLQEIIGILRNNPDLSLKDTLDPDKK